MAAGWTRRSSQAPRRAACQPSFQPQQTRPPRAAQRLHRATRGRARSPGGDPPPHLHGAWLCAAPLCLPPPRLPRTGRGSQWPRHTHPVLATAHSLPLREGRGAVPGGGLQAELPLDVAAGDDSARGLSARARSPGVSPWSPGAQGGRRPEVARPAPSPRRGRAPEGRLGRRNRGSSTYFSLLPGAALPHPSSCPRRRVRGAEPERRSGRLTRAAPRETRGCLRLPRGLNDRLCDFPHVQSLLRNAQDSRTCPQRPPSPPLQALEPHCPLLQPSQVTPPPGHPHARLEGWSPLHARHALSLLSNTEHRGPGQEELPWATRSGPSQRGGSREGPLTLPEGGRRGGGTDGDRPAGAPCLLLAVAQRVPVGLGSGAHGAQGVGQLCLAVPCALSAGGHDLLSLQQRSGQLLLSHSWRWGGGQRRQSGLTRTGPSRRGVQQPALERAVCASGHPTASSRGVGQAPQPQLMLDAQQMANDCLRT